MIPNTINKIKVSLNIGHNSNNNNNNNDNLHTHDNLYNIDKEAQSPKQHFSPHSPTFKKVEQKLKKLNIEKSYINQSSPISSSLINIQSSFTPIQPSIPNNNTQSSIPSINTVGKHGQSQYQYIKHLQNKKPNTQMRTITIRQLSQHKSKQSAWLSLDGVVYDVTIYLKHHPGGNILLQGCGKQCRPLFNQYHPWVNGKNLLGKYKIGWLSN